MKLYKSCTVALVCLTVLSGCGKDMGEAGESVVPAVSDEGADELSEAGAAGAAEAGAAQTAYTAFLEGDISLFDSEDISLWGLEDWKDTFLIIGGLEYVCLDLDGDGIEELLVQYVDDPSSYNGVFHYENGRLSCWQFDGMEGSCRDYPLQDGTMVRQYDYGESIAYTLFRYQSGGETEELSSLFLREELPDPDSDAPCPYYEVDGNEVDKAVFEERLKELVTDQMLERSVWTGI